MGNFFNPSRFVSEVKANLVGNRVFASCRRASYGSQMLQVLPYEEYSARAAHKASALIKQKTAKKISVNAGNDGQGAGRMDRDE
jgi:hypothetical protein